MRLRTIVLAAAIALCAGPALAAHADHGRGGHAVRHGDFHSGRGGYHGGCVYPGYGPYPDTCFTMIGPVWTNICLYQEVEMAIGAIVLALLWALFWIVILA